MRDLPIITHLRELVQEEDGVGAIFTMNYERAVVATNDYYQDAVGGIPKRGFLTAVSRWEGSEPMEVILLGVVQPTDLTTGESRATYDVRADLALKGASDSNLDALDDSTKARLQSLAFECSVLGTFYKADDGSVRFGGDVDRVRGNSLFRVFRPRGRALSLIASYGRNVQSAAANSSLLDVGVVRYSETQTSPDAEARVFIDVKDFVGKKSFAMGTTRSGKSNTIKTLLQKVHFYGKQRGEPIAQLIFDPQGEYANTNSQDGEALANIGDASEVSIYKIMEQAQSPKEKHLQFDLFADENLPLTWGMTLKELDSGASKAANYTRPLYNVQFPSEAPTDKQLRIHYNRNKLGLFALMSIAGFSSRIKDLYISVGEGNVEWLLTQNHRGELEASSHGKGDIKVKTLKAALLLLKTLKERQSDLSDSWKRDFEDGDLRALAEQVDLIENQGRNGVKAALQRLRPLHNSSAVGDIRSNVWEDVRQGKLIVVDLSRGSTKIAQALAELIVDYLVQRANERFTTGLQPIPFQIVVEEAHNLFSRDGRADEEIDPWVRLSKEASKYHIGLLYATQEATSVDPRILSNTSNWIVAHVNSAKETGELSKYYSFSEWADHIRRTEAKGFVRLKTESSPFIVPVQIDLFQAKALPQARPSAVIAEPKVEPKKKAPQGDDLSLGSFEELDF